MGKAINDFVPVKYASEEGQNNNNLVLNLMISLFMLFMYQIWKTMHGGGGFGKSSVKGTG